MKPSTLARGVMTLGMMTLGTMTLAACGGSGAQNASATKDDAAPATGLVAQNIVKMTGTFEILPGFGVNAGPALVKDDGSVQLVTFLNAAAQAQALALLNLKVDALGQFKTIQKAGLPGQAPQAVQVLVIDSAAAAQ